MRDKSGLGPDLDPEALTIVEIADSVTEIKVAAFQFCKQVSKVIIPGSVTRMWDRAFAGCSSLVSVNIPSSVTRIGASAFSGCSSLTSVDIDSYIDIGWHAFFDCTQLTLTAPANIFYLPIANGCKFVAKECGCGRCNWRWFRKGWVCPVHFPGQRRRPNADGKGH